MTLTVSSPLSPGASRSSGVSTSMAASPARAWTSDCIRKNSSSGSRLASGAPASPTVTSSGVLEHLPERVADPRRDEVPPVRPSPAAARTVTSQLANPFGRQVIAERAAVG